MTLRLASGLSLEALDAASRLFTGHKYGHFAPCPPHRLQQPRGAVAFRAAETALLAPAQHGAVAELRVAPWSPKIQLMPAGRGLLACAAESWVSLRMAL